MSVVGHIELFVRNAHLRMSCSYSRWLKNTTPDKMQFLVNFGEN